MTTGQNNWFKKIKQIFFWKFVIVLSGFIILYSIFRFSTIVDNNIDNNIDNNTNNTNNANSKDNIEALTYNATNLDNYHTDPVHGLFLSPAQIDHILISNRLKLSQNTPSSILVAASPSCLSITRLLLNSRPEAKITVVYFHPLEKKEFSSVWNKTAWKEGYENRVELVHVDMLKKTKTKPSHSGLIAIDYDSGNTHHILSLLEQLQEGGVVYLRCLTCETKNKKGINSITNTKTTLHKLGVRDLIIHHCPYWVWNMTQGLTFHLFWKNPQYFWNIVDYHRWEITCFSGTKNTTGKGGGTVILPICREPRKSKPKCGEHCYHCNLSSWMDYPLSHPKVEESEEYRLLKTKIKIDATTFKDQDDKSKIAWVKRNYCQHFCADNGHSLFGKTGDIQSLETLKTTATTLLPFLEPRKVACGDKQCNGGGHKTGGGINYEPDTWNCPKNCDTQHSHNCYTYVLNDINSNTVKKCHEEKKKGEKCGKFFHQPGYYHQHHIEKIPKKDMRRNTSDKLNCPDLLGQVKKDNKGIIKFTKWDGSEYGAQEQCPAGYYMGALTIDPSNMYHFYRRDQIGKDGKYYWSHKDGGAKATRLDANNKPITDPAKADRKYEKYNYSEVCPYFCIPENNISNTLSTHKTT